MTDLAFGVIDPTSNNDVRTSGTLSYNCSNPDASTVSALVCFSAWSVAGDMQGSGGGTIQYGMFQDPGLVQLWGSQFVSGQGQPATASITLGPSGSISGMIPIYGFIAHGSFQNPNRPPGNYIDRYTGGPFGSVFTINQAAGTTSPSSCDTTVAGTYTFAVTAMILPACSVTAGSGANINLGSVPSSTVNATASGAISVNCASGTPYAIGLQPSNGNTNGLGSMQGASYGRAVPYQLRSTPGLGGTPWGDQGVSATSVGNGVSGTGNGAPQVIPTYVTVPSANQVPDTYVDTVTVTLFY